MNQHPAHQLSGLNDPQHFLETIAEDLSKKFAGVFAAETVERYVFESYTALKRLSTTTVHLPLLTERFAKDRLTALAQSKDALPHDVPEVLFVCVQNSGRSQMAAALLNHHGQGRVHVRSAGSMPDGVIETFVLAAMVEVGVEMTEAFPKPLTDDVVRAADVVITMGCGDACPIYPGKRYEDWELADPAGATVAEVAAIRDDIESRVQKLLTQLVGTPEN